ncbi:putative acetyltransferase [Rosa sericea]
MTRIRHISTSTVQPTSHNGQLAHRIELTPWDLRPIKLDYIQKGLLFHKYYSSENEVNQISLVQHLISSLSQALDIFYPLAGRLAVTENEDNSTSCVFINCNDAGVEFLHAAADCVTVADILDSVDVPDDIVCQLIPMNGVRNCEGISKPLLAVQVTELADGIFIGCSINHSVVDATSYWHFLNTWSEISRSGSDHQMTPPIFHRQFLDGVIELPIHLPLPYNELLPSQQQIMDQSSSVSLRTRVFHFPKEKVAQLKAKANAEMGTNNISSLQALMAHFWCATIRNRHDLNPDEEVGYFIATGLRQRLKPPLPKEYFGNALEGISVKSTAGELLQNGIGWAALHINKKITSITSDDARKYAENFAKNPTFFPNLRDIVPSQTSTTALLTGSSPRFNV